ncbi:MAG TPA: carboxypeptidase-like regulatory domain-containing protein [Vicinamibacterales bacterium]|nr:carboxypeptidase-like regulatory domain-containing protein [Vicinamibacterales bacterium]
MRYSRVAGLSVVVLAAALSVGAADAGQRAGGPGGRRTPSGPPANAGVIVGRVVDANTNIPVRRAQIQATNDQAYVDATSDDEGRFTLTGLSPGEWQVTVQKGGYFPWHIGQRRPFEIPPPVKIAPRQRLTADIPLSRGGVIAGRVFDENGEPLAGLQVKVYRARMAQGYRRLESVGVADRTDDTGAYRIYALPPGDYYVAASLRMAPADSIVETTYSPTYYPGTGNLGEAQRIRIDLGTEATAIFPLLPIRHVRVSGTLLSSSGAPADAFLNLESENSELGMPLGIGAVTKGDGGFTIADVPPGRYTLTASSRGDGPYETADMPIVVGNDDITGLSLVTQRSAGMRGRFVADAGVARALPQSIEVTAVAARVNGTVLSHASGQPFTLGDLAEPFYLRVSLPEGWAVTTISVGGIDVTDGTITLPAGQQSDARIVITDRIAQVSGTVTAAGRPAKAAIVIFAADPSTWTFPTRYVRRVSTDDQGRYSIAGLPPNERYLAIAADYLEDGEHLDPDFLERVREVALPFPLREAEARTLDLPLLTR